MWDTPSHLEGEDDAFSTTDTSMVDRLLKMEPKVECTGDSMKLQVQDATSSPTSVFFVDRGKLMLLWYPELTLFCT